jgi:hypothetical protein
VKDASDRVVVSRTELDHIHLEPKKGARAPARASLGVSASTRDRLRSGSGDGLMVERPGAMFRFSRVRRVLERGQRGTASVVGAAPRSPPISHGSR